jgi:hypothetical protein
MIGEVIPVDVVEVMDATARELVTLARQRGTDIAAFCEHSLFQKDGRWIYMWRQDGEVRYNLQGRISSLPDRFKSSESAFRGMWHESGRLPDIERSLEFLRAWLIDLVEVDQLPFPDRYVKRAGI